MQRLSDNWFKSAEDDLVSAQILCENKKYSQAIFLLQQSCEKASKGYLMRFGFLPGDKKDELTNKAATIVGIHRLNPQDYGHEWHKKMVEVLGSLVNAYDAQAKEIKSLISEGKLGNFIEEFRKRIPDFKDRISRAKKVKANPNPSVEELNGVIKSCNDLLDKALNAKTEAAAMVQKINLPDKEWLIQTLENSFQTKVDKEALQRITRVYSKKRLANILERQMILAETLGALAILNAYLLPHEQCSRYPDTEKDFEYGDNLPIVMKFNELANLLKRSLAIAKTTG